MKVPPFAHKELGQHFLRDPKIIETICADFAGQASGILEIGPGPGTLTEHLALLKLPFAVIEIDPRFEDTLAYFLPPDKIKIGDALKEDLGNYSADWLVSNLPYNAASPLLVKFIKTPSLKFMTLMFQKEVGDRILAHEMNSLGALTQTFFKVSLLCKVSAKCFVPPPRVESIVLSFWRKKDPLVPLQEVDSFEVFLRRMFKMRRKQLINVLKTDYEPPLLEKALGGLKTARAQDLALDQVIKLYRALGV
jgi:16S rRNA (adenine1518-N6/adenine1519-N6)-dimethyltransferase